MKKRVLVTEGAGFLGLHPCTKLLSEECEILRRVVSSFIIQALKQEPVTISMAQGHKHAPSAMSTT